MRRTIHLTGRKQLPLSHFAFDIREVGESQLVVLGLADEIRRSFPHDARIRVKLVENKRVEICDFGTVGSPKVDVDVGTLKFYAPSCQIRISRSEEPEGMLLGSTAPWTFKSGGAEEGILIFQAKPIAPKLWELEIRDQEYPLLSIDERVPDAATWAGTSPVFRALVFPTVLREVFRHIFVANDGQRPDDGWMHDWIKLADALFGGAASPPKSKDATDIDRWCDELIDTFLVHFSLGDQAVEALRKQP